MAIYETGTATGTSDLISKLATFAAARGWTVAAQTTSAASGSPATSTPGRVFSKGSLVFGIGYDSSNILIAPATAVNGSASWIAQTGSSVTSSSGLLPTTNSMPGPYQAYHFFAGSAPDYLHVVVERTSGIFNHFAIGELVKAGSYTGGAYGAAVGWQELWSAGNYANNVPDSIYHSLMFDALTSNTGGYGSVRPTVIRADIDGKTNNWMPIRTNWGGNNAHGDIRGNAFSQDLHARAPSQFNQLTPLHPIIITADRPSNLYSFLGHVPDMRGVNMTNLSAGQLLTIGSDDWLIFPAIQKTATWDSGNTTSTNQQRSSGTYGYAYKRN